MNPSRLIRHFLLVLLLIGAALFQAEAQHAHGRSSTHSTSSGKHRITHSTTAPRQSKGKIKRSSSAKREFIKQTGYPKGRPGYVVDHIVPLSKGGADKPSNMQWQTKQEAKAKDKWERGGKSPSSKKKSKRK